MDGQDKQDVGQRRVNSEVDDTFPLLIGTMIVLE
jgi:hypothetical protein